MGVGKSISLLAGDPYFGCAEILATYGRLFVHGGRIKEEKTRKWRESCSESAKNAEFNTFSTIKVVNTSLLFAKVVLLYKVRNFAEHLRNFSTLFVFNKIL